MSSDQFPTLSLCVGWIARAPSEDAPHRSPANNKASIVQLNIMSLKLRHGRKCLTGVDEMS